MQSAARRTRLTVASERSFHRHALPSVLLGLLAPMLLFLLIDRRAYANASLVAHFYMVAIFVISSAAYLFSICDRGEVTAAEADEERRTVIIERTGLLAKSIERIPFADIAAVRMDAQYDASGFQTSIPVLVLKSRSLIALPAGTTETDIAELRTMLTRVG